MASNLVIRDDVGAVVAPGTFPEFSGVAPVTPTTAILREILNDDSGGSVDDALNVVILPKGFFQAVGAPDITEQGDGLPFLDVKSFEFRILDGVAGAELKTWQRVGFGAAAFLGDILEGESVFTEWRVNLPISAGSAAVRIAFDVVQVASTFLVSSYPATAGNGILRGGGRGDFTALFSASAIVSVSGIGTLTAPDYQYVHLGKWVSELGGATSGVETLDDTDSAAATLVATEEYPYRFSLGAGGRNITKGLKGTAPLTFPDDFPATPEGEIAKGFGTRHFVDDLSYTSVRVINFFDAIDVALNTTVQGGQAVVDASWVRTSAPTVVALTDSATNTIWLLSDGSYEVTLDGLQPISQPGALALWEKTTSGGSVTATIDLRGYVGDEIRTAHLIDMSTVDDLAVISNPLNIPVEFRPDSIRFELAEADPSTLGWTSGQWVIDILTLNAGVQTTIFTSQGSDDRRPQILFDATSGIAPASTPEQLIVAPGESAVVRLDEIPSTPGTEPEFGIVSWAWALVK